MFAEIIRNFVFRMEKVIKWNNEKNKWLKKERKLSFEAVLIAIDNGKLLDIVEHPDKKKYNGQKIFIVEIEKYVYMIPFIEDDDGIFLKTIFPSRKMTKKYFKNIENGNK